VYDWLSYDIVRFKIEVGVEEKCMYKNVTQQTQHGHCHSSSKLRLAAILAAARTVDTCRVSRNKIAHLKVSLGELRDEKGRCYLLTRE